MKKLLLILLAVGLTGSFTSCVENDLPEEVLSVYAGQGSVLEAQAAYRQAEAAVKAAEVARIAADVAFREAQTRAQEIANLLAEGLNALELQRVQEQNIIDLETARLALETAQRLENEAIAQAARDLLAAENQALSDAFGEYAVAKLNHDKKLNQIADKQIDILKIEADIAANETSDAEAFADLEAVLMEKEAELAVENALLADLEALLLPGSTIGDRIALKESYEARVAELDNLIHDITIANKILEQAKDAADDALTATGQKNVETDYTQLVADYDALVVNREAKKDDINSLKADNEANEDNIPVLENIVTNYATLLAGYEQAVADAEAAETAASDAKDAADAAATAADVALNGNGNDIEGEAPKLARLKDEADNAKADLDDKIDDLTAIVAAQLLTPAELDQAVTDAENALTAATNAYDAAVVLYNDAPNGETFRDPGNDGQLGNHDDNLDATYMKIVVNAGTGAIEFTGGKFTTRADVLSFEPTATFVDASSSPTTWYSALTAANDGQYYNVEAFDGPAEANADILKDAAADLEQAKVDVTDAIEDRDNAAKDKAEAEAAVQAAQAFLKSKEADVAAQEVAVTDATAAKTAADAAATAAATALTDASTAVNTAEGVLNSFNAKDLNGYTIELEKALVDSAAYDAQLAGLEAELATLEAQVAAIITVIENGPSYTAAQLDALAAYNAANQAFTDAEAVKDTYVTEKGLINAIVTLIEVTGVERTAIDDAITEKKSDIATLESAIVTAQSNIDNFTTSTATLESNLAQAEAELADLEVELDDLKLKLDYALAVYQALL